MLSYFNEIKGGDLVSSIDKIILTGLLLSKSNLDGVQRLMDIFSRCLFNFDYYQDYSSKIGRYKYNWNFCVCEGSSIYLGVGLISPGRDSERSFKIEFNPNKAGKTDVLSFVFSVLSGSVLEVNLKEFDFAFDFPVLRENCFLLKDKRKYNLIQNSDCDKTEYLGTRHNNGYCKLYNKQIESNLHSPLTRLEVTMKWPCSLQDIRLVFPSVFYINDLQMTFDELKIDGTDRVLIYAILKEPFLLRSLPRRKFEKIDRILKSYLSDLQVSDDFILPLFSQLEKWSQLVIPQNI